MNFISNLDLFMFGIPNFSSTHPSRFSAVFKFGASVGIWCCSRTRSFLLRGCDPQEIALMPSSESDQKVSASTSDVEPVIASEDNPQANQIPTSNPDSLSLTSLDPPLALPESELEACAIPDDVAPVLLTDSPSNAPIPALQPEPLDLIPSDPGLSSLVLEIYGRRVAVGSTLTLALLITITALLISGFTLTTLDANTLDETTRTNLQDQYNSYSGYIVTVVATPFQGIVDMLLPVFFLCFTTKTIRKTKKSFVEQWTPVLVAYLISWMLGQGMNSLNVRFDANRVEYVISTNDLRDVDTVFQFDLVATNIYNTTHVAGVNSTNTILRRAIHPTETTQDTTCTYGHSTQDATSDPYVRYGFRTTSWLQYMLPQSVASSWSYSFSMSHNFTTDPVDSAVFANKSLNSTASLLIYSFWTMFAQFGDPSDSNHPDVIYDWLMPLTNTPSKLLTNMQTVVQNVTDIIDARNDTQMGIWINISVPDITIEITSFDLTPEITFDAVTFALPLDANINHIWMSDHMVSDKYFTGSDPSDNYYRLGTPPRCNENACAIGTPNINETNQDQIRLIRLCMNSENDTTDDIHNFHDCNAISRSSVLVYSVARHIAMDDLYMDINSNNASRLIMRNPKLTYYVTVGRLSWKTIKLAPIYGAVCEDKSNCTGLKFALSNGQQHLVLGKDHVPVPRQITYPENCPAWQVLAVANTQIDTYYQGSVVYPSMYTQAAGETAWSPRSGSNCTSMGSTFINDILQQHMYSYDSLQPAYTAAMYWLFQNAAVVDRTNTTTDVRLDFVGNQVWTSLHVSIPYKSAIISIVGCAAVWLMGLMVAYWSRNHERQETFAGKLPACEIPSMLIGVGRYPSDLVRIGVKNGVNETKTHANTDACGDPVDQFDIASITLRHLETNSVRTVAILPHLIAPVVKEAKQ